MVQIRILLDRLCLAEQKRPLARADAVRFKTSYLFQIDSKGSVYTHTSKLAVRTMLKHSLPRKMDSLARICMRLRPAVWRTCTGCKLNMSRCPQVEIEQDKQGSHCIMTFGQAFSTFDRADRGCGVQKACE
jgi:NAD-dependent dihydropyrimidine dehydrogenase PreA subunit